jgi:hypothetical protein
MIIGVDAEKIHPCAESIVLIGDGDGPGLRYRITFKHQRATGDVCVVCNEPLPALPKLTARITQ